MTQLIDPDARWCCTECGEECEVKIKDEGIGSYEFWGQTGTDHQYAIISKCCNEYAEQI